MLSASPTVTCYWSFKTVWKTSVVVFSRYRFKWSSNFMPRASTLLAWADVRVGFPSALMRVVALMAFFCSIHSFLCNCGDRMERLDRHLTSEGCNTFSMAKTSGKTQCAPYYKNTITYSTSVYCYYKSPPSKSLTITFMWRLPIPRDAPWRISILISIITMLLLLLLLLFLLLLLLLFLLLLLLLLLLLYHYYYYYYYYYYLLL